MSDQGVTYSVEFERRGKEISSRRVFSELVAAIKQEFAITGDVVLEAVTNDGNEIEIWGDRFLEDVDNKASTIVVYSNPQNPCAISFGAKEYRLDSIPLSDTVLVAIAKEVVIPEFNVPNFVRNLMMFVSCVRLTHLHLLASGNCRLAVEIDRLGRSGLKPLSDKCAITLDLFVCTCRDILDTFRTVFAHCLDRLEAQAVINLVCLVKKASLMKDKSAEIVKDLEDQMVKTEKLLEGTSTKWVDENEQVERQGRHIETTKGQLEVVKEMHAHTEEVIEKAKKANEKYRTLNDEVNFVIRGFWNLRYWFSNGETPPNDTGYGKWADSWKCKVQAERSSYQATHDRKVAAEEERQLKKALQEAEKRGSKLAKQGGYLERGLKAIKNAHLTMQSMHSFWTKMEMAIAQLTDNEPFIECLRKSDNQVIKKLLRSRAFKRQGIIYMARCVAIRDISIHCGKGMSAVKNDMEEFLREMPSKEEAKTILENKEFVSRLEAPLTTVNPTPAPRVTETELSVTPEEREIRNSFQQPSGNWLQFELSTSVEVTHVSASGPVPSVPASVEVTDESLGNTLVKELY
ncbi:uncharacterized protein LOC135499876 isoform X1 [Lineus longissimus]|uniref:uncharacterized protein LOC135499876 isoform X1 n=1 Tax=Lineus longissimus TaxID=88925 RepID=UPI002B4C8296